MGMLAALAVLAASRARRALAVRGTLRTAPRTALVTSMGYYGNASALVMRAAVAVEGRLLQGGVAAGELMVAARRWSRR